MSWEVWTMPQKTSFCNRTLLRSDLRHFWPTGFVYVLIWLMILPIQLLRAGYDAPRDDGLLAENLEPLLHNVIVGASVGSLVLAVVCGVVIPMAVYAYLMTPRSVGMMHALPVKRTTQYFSHFLAGFGLLTAGNLLIFLLSVLAQLPFGMVDWSALGQWLLLTELLELFFLSLGALCAMVTGWLLAIPVLYVAVNFAALLLCSVVQFLQRWFYFGFQYTTYPPFVQWLTPIIKLAEDVGFLDGEYITRNGIEVYWRSLSAQALPTSAIYAAVGLALLALGWLLYRKRPSETAGDAIAFPWLRILVRWAVGLCGGLGLGLFLSSFVLGGSRSLAKLLLCQVFMGLLCFVAAQMLLQKTFRVFRRSWKELAALAAAMVALTLAIRADVLGVQYRVPDVPQVDNVRVTVSRCDGGNFLASDSTAIETVTSLHRAILEQGSENTDGSRVLYVSFYYTMKNGQEIRRNYGIAEREGAETYRKINQLLNLPQARSYAVGITDLTDEELDTVRGGFVEDSDTGFSVDLTREQALALCRAAQQDVAAAVDTDMLAAIDTDTAQTWRYQMVIYSTTADGGTRDRYLSMMSYCTRMQEFIDGLDFTNSTADVIIPEVAS